MQNDQQIHSASFAYLLGKLDSDMRDQLREALLQSGEQKYIDLAGQVHDRGDESVADELTDVGNALIDRYVRELREIEAARARLARGELDRCADCGDAIGFARLTANPLAVRCIECERRHDHTHAHAATPRM